MEFLILPIVACAMLIVFAIIGSWLVARDRKGWRQRTMQMAMETDPRIKADVERRLKRQPKRCFNCDGLGDLAHIGLTQERCPICGGSGMLYE